MLWFRRDLRIGDNPALLAARDAADEVLPVFVLDDALWGPAGDPRRAFLLRCLRDLEDRLDGALVVRRGPPQDVVPALAEEVGAATVHVAADFGPYGRARDDRVERALGDAGRQLVRTGSPYAIAPGRVTKDDGTPYKVFTPFFRAWKQHGWRAPAPTPRALPWATGVRSDPLPDEPDLGGTDLPAAGEQAGLDRLRTFVRDDLAGYAANRDDPGADRTSRLSPYLKYGLVHPRTVLDALAGSDAPAEDREVLRTEIAWREFYAAVLADRPDSAREYYSDALAGMRYDTGREADEQLAAWVAGRTGFPIVDAACGSSRRRPGCTTGSG